MTASSIPAARTRCWPRPGPRATAALELARHYEDAFRADCSALNIRPAGLLAARIRVDRPDDRDDREADRDRARLRHRRRLGVLRRALVPRLRRDVRQPARTRCGPVTAPAARSTGRSASTPTGRCGRAPDPGRELTWPAPWGTGFPGWHTECSAMSLHYLGEIIDIHTGGIDLRFPHHEDERAQSECSNGARGGRHWVHGEHVLFEGRKMAKSTRNVVLRQRRHRPRAGSAGPPACACWSTGTGSR